MHRGNLVFPRGAGGAESNGVGSTGKEDGGAGKTQQTGPCVCG